MGKSAHKLRRISFFWGVIGVFLLITFPLFSQQGSEAPALPPYDSVVSDEYTLDRLASQVRSGNVSQIPKDKYMLIEGVVSSRQLIQAEEENYLAILEISSGEWHDGEDLEMYRCYFQLRGPEFFGVVPEGRSRTESPEEIPLHSHLLLVGTYLGYGEDAQGKKFPVLEAVKIRRLRM